MELLDHCQTGPGPLEGFEEQTHRRLHLGVRIEDDILVTEGGFENLTGAIPRSVRDVEESTRR